MRKSLSSLTGLALLAAVPAAAEDLNYVGSSTVGKFVADAMEVYDGPAFAIDTRPESSGGESCPARGACSIGGVAREVKAAYLDQGVVATLIGKDAIAAIVHADNPIDGLDTAQLKGIFTGTITNWSELGGPDAPIRPLIVKNGSATRNVFQNAVLGGDAYGDVQVVTPDAKVVATVARDPHAIGQISFAFIQGNGRIKPLAVDGQEATVSNADYPITRPLYLTTKGVPAGEAKAFIDWALSADGQAVLTERFVGVN